MSDEHDLDAAATHLIYEFGSMSRLYVRTVEFDRAGPADLRVACLEATLVHTRILIEFLAGRSGKKGRRWKTEDITPLNFLPEWVGPGDLLDGYLDRIDKLRAHLSWSRADREPPTIWALERMVRDVVVQCANFAAAAQRCGSPYAGAFEANMRSAWDTINAVTPMKHPADATGAREHVQRVLRRK
jgi:hypothetical protein